MQNLVENLQFKANISFVTENSLCFRSRSYPPNDDFVMSVNQSGEVVSRYGDDSWDFTPFGSTQKFQFKVYDEANKALFKKVLYYLIYSHLFPGKYASLAAWYSSLQNIFRASTKAKIKASELFRFPRVIEEMAISCASRAPSNFRTCIYHYDVLLKNKDQIGFKLLNETGIAIFRKFAPQYQLGQTPYIPHSIWTKFIQYLDSILDDFESHQEELRNLYHYTAQTTLLNERNGVSHRYSSPFTKARRKSKKYYEGTFEDYLKSHELLGLFEKYIERPQSTSFSFYKLDQLGAMLNNMVVTCYLYILFYSIMRRNEALSLRIDCLHVESDEQTGGLYLLKGETTKTDPDSDARWIVPKRVERAVNIAKNLVGWKLEYISVPPDETPHLFQTMNVWQAVHRTHHPRAIKSLDNVFEKALHFFKPEQFEITKDDYEEALALTPSLNNSAWFKIGGTWNFAYHQFRRTLAVFFSLNKVSASSTQFQMKHGTREQQFHYQNNAGRLRLNKSAEQEVVNEFYAEMSRNQVSVFDGELVLPHKRLPVNKDVVRFIENGEMKKLLKAQKNGAVGYRKNLLGGCMKQGPCEYGGFDSIVQCAGGVTGNMCSALIIDGSREKEFQEDKAYTENQLSDVPEESPRHRSLEAEVRGYENVLDAIKRR